MAGLEQAAAEVDAEVENWTTNLQVLCQACSAGRPHGDHDHDHDREVPGGPHRIAIAHPDMAVVKKLTSEWALAQQAGATVSALECVLS